MLRSKTPLFRRFIFLSACLLYVVVTVSRAADLYFTDFEDFLVGPDRWVGADGWSGNNNGFGVHGIDQDIVPGFGKTAYLGYYPPPSTFTTVFRPVNYDPVASNTPVVEFETLMGIQDSTNGRGDSFFFTFYNRLGQPLAAVRFSNNPLSTGIWRWDGAVQHSTGMGFYHGQMHLLFCSIDFRSNRWMADLDGIPLFTNAVFNATDKTLDLYAVAAEWQLTAGSTNMYGNNWLLVADWGVRAIPEGEWPVILRDIGATSNGNPVISWLGEPGFTYEVNGAESLLNDSHFHTLTVFSNLSVAQTLTFTNTVPADLRSRFYRLNRAVTP